MLRHVAFTLTLAVAILKLHNASIAQVNETHGADPSSPTHLLVEYLEHNNLGINSHWMPASISAYETYQLLDSQTLVIDLRPIDEFNQGHVAGAVNVQFSDLLPMFEGGIDPSSFSRIVITCRTGQTSGYVSGLLRFLGYNNVFNMRFGMSGWHKPVADNYWLAKLSSEYSNQLEFTPNEQPPVSPFPIIKLDGVNIEEIIRERVATLFAEGFGPSVVEAKELFEAKDSMLIVSYLPLDIYNKGHIPGSVHYAPKRSLGMSQHLGTLTPDKPIALYCYSGNHTAFVAAYLRLLGYDARNVLYGMNGFMHGFMQENGIGGTFGANQVENLPVVLYP